MIDEEDADRPVSTAIQIVADKVTMSMLEVINRKRSKPFFIIKTDVEFADYFRQCRRIINESYHLRGRVGIEVNRWKRKYAGVVVDQTLLLDKLFHMAFRIILQSISSLEYVCRFLGHAIFKDIFFPG